jgi:hypothetical protein
VRSCDLVGETEASDKVNELSRCERAVRSVFDQKSVAYLGPYVSSDPRIFFEKNYLDAGALQTVCDAKS